MSNRKRRPLLGVSETKPRLHRSFARPSSVRNHAWRLAPLSSPLPSHREILFPVNSLNSFPVHYPPVPPEQDVDASVAPSNRLGRGRQGQGPLSSSSPPPSRTLRYRIEKRENPVHRIGRLSEIPAAWRITATTPRRSRAVTTLFPARPAGFSLPYFRRQR